jgi:hypothetical protein
MCRAVSVVMNGMGPSKMPETQAPVVPTRLTYFHEIPSCDDGISW